MAFWASNTEAFFTDFGDTFQPLTQEEDKRLVSTAALGAPKEHSTKRWKDMEVTCIMNIDMDVSACSCLADFNSDDFHADSPAFPLCFVL